MRSLDHVLAPAAIGWCAVASALLTAACSETRSTAGTAPEKAVAGEAPRAAAVQAGRPASGPSSGTADMVALLQELRAAASPEFDRYRNAERVPLLEQRLAQARDQHRPTLQLRLALASEKLGAGQQDDAIADITSVLRDLDAGVEPSTPALRAQTLELLATAWMRVGEQGNCVLHHGAESCLFPISAAGRDADPTGSRHALDVLADLLHGQPWNMKARWLLNVAAMTVGDWPDRVPPEFLVPPAAVASQEDVGRFADVAARCGLTDRGLAGGVCLDDFDGDGNLDLIVSDWTPGSSLHEYRNDGAGRFEDRSNAAGLSGLGPALNLLHADVDNDGDDDVVVLRGGWKADIGATLPFSLLANDGHGNFADVTRAAGLFCRLCSPAGGFADVDGDGQLDLFVANESVRVSDEPCRLFHNAGDGTFREVGAAAGLDVRADVKSCAWGDFDDDGDPDLVLGCADSRPLLFRNDGGRFAEVGAQAGLTSPLQSGPCFWFDDDNDGHLDLCITSWEPDQTAEVCRDVLGLPNSGAAPSLYRNRGDGTFALVTAEAGLLHALPTLGCNVGDIDNDGWPDIYFGTGEPDLCALYPNRLYRNDAGKRFVDVTTSAGMGHLQKGAAVAIGDIDNDGDQDVFEVMGGFFEADTFPRVLFENPGHAGHWVTLWLQGVRANRSAIGARITVHVRRAGGAGRDIRVVVGTGASSGSQSLQAEIGLGDATAIETVEIAWPGSGTHQVLRDLAMDRTWRVVEGQPQAEPMERRAIRLGGTDR